MISFYEWMITTHIDDDSPAGDLAFDMKHDENFPRNGGLREIYQYLDGHDNMVLRTFVDAYADYVDYSHDSGRRILRIPNREAVIREHIKRLVEAEGSVKAFCLSTGISQPTVYNMLNNKRPMSLSRFLWFCDALRCNPSEILGHADCYSPLSIDNTRIDHIYPYNLAKAILKCKDSELHQIDGRSLIVVMKGSLTECESDVLEMRFKFHMKLEECGRKYNVTRERIRQIESKAMRKMRHCSRLRLYKLVPLRTVKDIQNQNAVLVAENERLKLKLKLESESQIDFDLKELGLSVRSYNCLARRGIKKINDAKKISLCDLCKVRNFGIKSFEEVISKLKEYGVILEFDKQCDVADHNCTAKKATHKLYGSIGDYESGNCGKAEFEEGTEEYEL